jgi:hypothetical protein
VAIFCCAITSYICFYVHFKQELRYMAFWYNWRRKDTKYLQQQFHIRRTILLNRTVGMSWLLAHYTQPQKTLGLARKKSEDSWLLVKCMCTRDWWMNHEIDEWMLSTKLLTHDVCDKLKLSAFIMIKILKNPSRSLVVITISYIFF